MFPTCSCRQHCRTQAEMKERHGTPGDFHAALSRAITDGVTLNETRVALARYEQEWKAVGEYERQFLKEGQASPL